MNKITERVLQLLVIGLLAFEMLLVVIVFTSVSSRAGKKLDSDIQIIYRSLSDEYARHALFLVEEEHQATVGEIEYLRALSRGTFESGEQVAHLYREFLRILAEKEKTPFPDEPTSNRMCGDSSAFSYCSVMLRTCNALRSTEDDYRLKGADKVATAILVKQIDNDLSTYAPEKTEQ